MAIETPDKSIVWYLAGPMRGLPQCNIPAFDAAAKQLRDWGYTVVSPAELDAPETRADALTCAIGEDRTTYGGQTPGQILSRDVLEVTDHVQGIIFLDGWWNSRGARLEAFTALTAGGKQFAVFQPVGTYDVSNDERLTQSRVVKVSDGYVKWTLKGWLS